MVKAGLLRGICRPGGETCSLHSGWWDTLDLCQFIYTSHPGEWAEGGPAQPGPRKLGTVEKGIQGSSGGSFSFHLKTLFIMVLQVLLSSVDSLEISHQCCQSPTQPAQPRVEVFSFYGKPSPSFTLLTQSSICKNILHTYSLPIQVAVQRTVMENHIHSLKHLKNAFSNFTVVTVIREAGYEVGAVEKVVVYEIETAISLSILQPWGHL